MMTTLRHVGIVVGSLEETLDFFLKVFNLSVVIDQVEEGHFIDCLLGLNGVKVRTVKLRADEGCLVELLEFCEPYQRKDQNRTEPFSLGLTHVALTVDSVTQTVEKMASFECEVIGGPLESVDGRVLVAYVRGPEGLLLEIVEQLENPGLLS